MGTQSRTTFVSYCQRRSRRCNTSHPSAQSRQRAAQQQLLRARTSKSVCPRTLALGGSRIRRVESCARPDYIATMFCALRSTARRLAAPAAVSAILAGSCSARCDSDERLAALERRLAALEAPKAKPSLSTHWSRDTLNPELLFTEARRPRSNLWG